MSVKIGTVLLLVNIALVYCRPQVIHDSNIKIQELSKNPHFAQLFSEFLQQYQEQFVNNTTQAPAVVPNQQQPTTDHSTRLSDNPPLANAIRQANVESQTERILTNRQTFAELQKEPARTHIRRRPVIGTTTKAPVITRKGTTPLSALLSNYAAQTTANPQQIAIVSLPVAALKFDEAAFRKQAENAKYEFASEVDDTINGQQQQREESRNGLAVKGKYSYDDGFYKRTVHYEADDKGYRVVNEETESVGSGPQINPEGHAIVSQYVAGNTVNYQITKDDIVGKQKVLFHSEPEVNEDAL